MDIPQQVRALRRSTVLLISRNPTLSTPLAERFHAEGFAVLRVDGVQDAIRHARTCQPDLVVVDPGPQPSVSRVLDRLRSDELTRQVPIIVLRRTESCIDTSVRPAHAATAARVDDTEIAVEHLRRVLQARVRAVANEPGCAATPLDRPVDVSLVDTGPDRFRVAGGGGPRGQ